MNVCDSLFLFPFFTALNQAGTEYAVLRNAETLPDSLNGGDVDILVSPKDFIAVEKILGRVAEACGGKVMAKMRVPHFIQTEMMGCVSGVWWGCCIDLFDGIYVKSALPIVGESVLRYRERTAKAIWTLHPLVGQYLGYAKELLVNGRKSIRYEAGAKKALQSDLDAVVPSPSMRGLIRSALQGKVVHPHIFVLKESLLLAIRHPLHLVRNYAGFVCSRIVRYIRPCGKMIAVLGTDGSGKSTLLNEILPLLQTMTHKATCVHHLKPDILPPLGRFRGVKYEPGHICTNPHGSAPSGFVGSLVRISYLSLDYILGYWLKVRVKIAKTPISYWIFDRYAHDMLIDSRRFRIRLPQWIIRMFLGVLPKPDQVICLGGDAAKIYARKPETSLEEVERQVKELRNFVHENKNAVWVDTTQSVEASVRAFLEGLMDA